MFYYFSFQKSIEVKKHCIQNTIEKYTVRAFDCMCREKEEKEVEK
jgi:hypothetical protein